MIETLLIGFAVIILLPVVGLIWLIEGAERQEE